MHPQSLGAGQSIINDADLLFPRFIVIGLPVGFSGLVLAGLLAASMSSLSSGINSSALSIINDFIIRFRRYPISETGQVKLAKIISIGIGVIIVSLSFFIGNIKGNLLELTYKTVNLLVAPLFVPFFMAMFVPWAKPTATFIGTLASGIAAILISYSQEMFSVNISFLWIIPASFSVGVIIGLVLSLLPSKKARSTFNRMNQRLLGHTGINVSEIAFGGVEIGVPYGIGVKTPADMISESEAIYLLHEAINRGINLYDTARLYGTSEAIMGQAFQDRRDRVIICTKCQHFRDRDGHLPPSDRLIRIIKDSLKDSLKELKTDYIDVYMLHQADAGILENEMIAKIFVTLKNEGIIRATGVSTYALDETR